MRQKRNVFERKSRENTNQNAVIPLKASIKADLPNTTKYSFYTFFFHLTLHIR